MVSNQLTQIVFIMRHALYYQIIKYAALIVGHCECSTTANGIIISMQSLRRLNTYLQNVIFYIKGLSTFYKDRAFGQPDVRPYFLVDKS